MLFKLDQFRKFRDAHVPKHQFETTSLLYGLTILHSKTWGLMFFSTAGYCESYGECTTSSGEEIWISESTLLFNISKPIGSMGLVYLPLFAQVNFPNMDPMQKKLQKLTFFEELHYLPKLFMGKNPTFYSRQAGHASKPNIIKSTLSNRDIYEANQSLFTKERRGNF